MDHEGALRSTLRQVIDPENVWTYLPMILVYLVSAASLSVYRIGSALHPWAAPGVVLVLSFYLVVRGAAKVDDWWISRGGSVPSNILAESKMRAAEDARTYVATYAPLAVTTFWLAYGLIVGGGGGAVLPELASNAASLVVFLLVVGVTYVPALRQKMAVAAGTAVLALAISLFAPGRDSLASQANLLVSLHKVTAFSLLYLLAEMGDKLRHSPMHNGYSASYVKKILQAGWILFSGRFVSLLAWAQVALAIWVIRRRGLRSQAFQRHRRSAKAKTEDIETPEEVPVAQASPPQPFSAVPNGNYDAHQQQQRPVATAVPDLSPPPPQHGRLPRVHGSRPAQWPPQLIHGPPSSCGRGPEAATHVGGTSVRRSVPPSVAMRPQNHRRQYGGGGGNRRLPPRVAKPGRSPLDRTDEL